MSFSHYLFLNSDLANTGGAHKRGAPLARGGGGYLGRLADVAYCS